MSAPITDLRLDSLIRSGEIALQIKPDSSIGRDVVPALKELRERRANARDVADSLRKWADAAELRLALIPDAYLEEQMKLSGYISANRQLADQLDPKP